MSKDTDMVLKVDLSDDPEINRKAQEIMDNDLLRSRLLYQDVQSMINGREGFNFHCRYTRLVHLIEVIIFAMILAVLILKDFGGAA